MHLKHLTSFRSASLTQYNVQFFRVKSKVLWS